MHFFGESISTFLPFLCSSFRSCSIFNSYFKTTSCVTMRGHSTASSHAQYSLTALVECYLFPLHFLDFLSFESCVSPLLPRPGATRPFAEIIDFISHTSLDMSYSILEDEGNIFQVLRNMEESQLEVERKNFLGSLWVEILVHVMNISTPPSIREIY